MDVDVGSSAPVVAVVGDGADFDLWRSTTDFLSHSWLDAVDRRRGAVRHAQPVPERPHRARLQRLEGVDEDAAGFRHPGSHADDALARLAVVRQPLRQVRNRERRSARERQDGGVPERREAGAHSGAHGGEAEEAGEAGGARGEEEVGGQAKLGGDVERVGAEHVEDDRLDAARRRLRRRQRAKEVAERRIRGAEEAEHPGQGDIRLGVVGGRRRRRWRGKHVQGDGGVGGLGARDRGGEAVGVDGRLEDRDGDVDLVPAVAEERLGQLEHRREVADADARVQHHRLLLHGSPG
jgi:hypothetical protein